MRTDPPTAEADGKDPVHHRQVICHAGAAKAKLGYQHVAVYFPVSHPSDLGPEGRESSRIKGEKLSPPPPPPES